MRDKLQYLALPNSADLRAQLVGPEYSRWRRRLRTTVPVSNGGEGRGDQLVQTEYNP
jgi:hypothetical protein